MAFRNFAEDPSEASTPAVLRREVPWETYLTARLISDRDLQLIRRYDKATRETQAQLLNEAGPAYVEALLSVLRNVTKEDTVQYVLALLDDLLTEDTARAKLFAGTAAQEEKRADPCNIFLRLLQRTDWFTQEKACRLLTAALGVRPPRPANGSASASAASSSRAPAANGSASSEGAVDPVLAAFVDWLCSQLRRPSHPSRSVLTAVTALSRLLRERPVRALLLRSGGVSLLGPLLRTPASAQALNVQLLYEASLCVWQLSFLPPAAEAIVSSGIVASLVQVARIAPKEKVARVALNALANLLAAPGLDAGPEAVEAGLPKVVAQRKQQNWEDEDVVAVLDTLDEALAANIQRLSSFDKYRREVLGGRLDWTPMHTSEAFWRENAAAFEEKDFQVLRVLLKLLESSREPKTLAVGCSDVGYFITTHPIGRQIVTDLRGKELVMRLMMHPDAGVQKQALLCVQKIMLARDKLEFLAAQEEA